MADTGRIVASAIARLCFALTGRCKLCSVQEVIERSEKRTLTAGCLRYTEARPGISPWHGSLLYFILPPHTPTHVTLVSLSSLAILNAFFLPEVTFCICFFYALSR